MTDDKFAVNMIIGSLIAGVVVLGILIVFTSENFVKGTATYMVCRPHNYEVVCFGKEGFWGKGELSCVPLSEVGGRCE